MPLKTLITLATIAGLLSLVLRRRDGGPLAFPAAGPSADALRKAALDVARHQPVNTMSPAAHEIDGSAIAWVDGATSTAPSSGRPLAVGGA